MIICRLLSYALCGIFLKLPLCLCYVSSRTTTHLSPLDLYQYHNRTTSRYPNSIYATESQDANLDSTGNDLFTGPRIDTKGKIINKKKKLYSYGSLRHVDDFFEGKYHVEWIVRGISEKLQFRRRDSGAPPLHTSRFTFAGIGGFMLRLWLDGLPSSKPGDIALSLLQKEHWTSLDSPLTFSVGKVTRGPFFFRSSPYFAALKSFCALNEVLEDNELHIRVSLATRN
eukprot:XP_001609210.1 hypothetical protein [Babesia bovis T2Bo]